MSHLKRDIYSQVYVISAERNGIVLPILYALLSDKSSNTYIRIFQLIKKFSPDFKPVIINIDYEPAMLKIVKVIFKDAQIFGCFFHLRQSCKEKMGEHHVLSKFKNDSDFAMNAKKILAISYVPIEDLDKAMDELYSFLPEDLYDICE